MRLVKGKSGDVSGAVMGGLGKGVVQKGGRQSFLALLTLKVLAGGGGMERRKGSKAQELFRNKKKKKIGLSFPFVPIGQDHALLPMVGR